MKRHTRPISKSSVTETPTWVTTFILASQSIIVQMRVAALVPISWHLDSLYAKHLFHLRRFCIFSSSSKGQREFDILPHHVDVNLIFYINADPTSCQIIIFHSDCVQSPMKHTSQKVLHPNKISDRNLL